jgi:phage gpG-like protein
MAIEQKILNDLRVELTDQFDENFKRQAFFDRPWTARKPVKGKRKRQGRALLIDTGSMRRSIRSRVISNGVSFTSHLAYTSVHNEGLRAGRGRGFTMPQRQFIGDHQKVQNVIQNVISENITEYLTALAKKAKK